MQEFEQKSSLRKWGALRKTLTGIAVSSVDYGPDDIWYIDIYAREPFAKELLHDHFVRLVVHVGLNVLALIPGRLTIANRLDDGHRYLFRPMAQRGLIKTIKDAAFQGCSNAVALSICATTPGIAPIVLPNRRRYRANISRSQKRIRH